MKKVIFHIISFLAGVTSAYVAIKLLFYKSSDEETIVTRYKKYYDVLNQWIYKINNEGSLENYFINNHIQKVAIYGMGELGERLSEEIEKMETVTLEYAIDSEPGRIFSDIPIYSKDENFPDVDVIIVTPVFAYDEIEQELSQKMSVKIISLDEVVSK